VSGSGNSAILDAVELVNLETQELTIIDAIEIYTPLANFLRDNAELLNGNVVGVDIDVSEPNAAGVETRTMVSLTYLRLTQNLAVDLIIPNNAGIML